MARYAHKVGNTKPTEQYEDQVIKAEYLIIQGMGEDFKSMSRQAVGRALLNVYFGILNQYDNEDLQCAEDSFYEAMLENGFKQAERDGQAEEVIDDWLSSATGIKTVENNGEVIYKSKVMKLAEDVMKYWPCDLITNKQLAEIEQNRALKDGEGVSRGFSKALIELGAVRREKPVKLEGYPAAVVILKNAERWMQTPPLEVAKELSNLTINQIPKKLGYQILGDEMNASLS